VGNLSQRWIRIIAGSVEVTACLNDTGTAVGVWDVLPVTGTVMNWGDELYFTIPLDMGPEAPREIVEAGDIAYWPQGKALCLFFGPTPISSAGEIRPASPVNMVAKIKGDPTVLRAVAPGTVIAVKRERDCPPGDSEGA
jgi:hypothetical protein